MPDCLNILPSLCLRFFFFFSAALNRPEELYTQIHALQPGLFPQHMAFGLRYCAGVKAAFGNGMDFKGSSHLRELHVLLKKVHTQPTHQLQ